MALAGPAQPALAIASAGVSQDCDAHGHCVTGSAFSSNGGVDLSGASADTTVAACKGGANGSVLIEVECSIGEEKRSTSLPGSAALVPMLTDTATLARVRVCWLVVGYFPNPVGEPFEVDTDGCALVAL